MTGRVALIFTDPDSRLHRREADTMPLFLDIHRHVPGLTKDAVHGAHQQDLAVQGGHDVEYLKYWFNEETGEVFCLVRAPDKEAAIRVHREAHGLIPDDIIEVEEGR